MNSFAGCQLCNRKPTQMPTMAMSSNVAIDAYEGELRARMSE